MPLLEPHLPRRHLVWDFLRALAEAGWLEPVLSVGWRARRWRLRRPSLLPLSPKAALVEGAVAAAAEHRLVEAVSRRGGRMTRQPALSDGRPRRSSSKYPTSRSWRTNSLGPFASRMRRSSRLRRGVGLKSSALHRDASYRAFGPSRLVSSCRPTQDRERKGALCSSAGFGSGRTIGMCFALLQRGRTSLRHPELQRSSRPIGAAGLRSSSGFKGVLNELRGAAICRYLWRNR